MTAGYEGKFIEEIEETEEPKTEKFYIFEENEAKIVLFYNDIEVKRFSTYNDFYGEMTCVSNAIKDAKEYAKTYDINKDSEGLFAVELIRYRIKKRKTGQKKYFRKDKEEYESVSNPIKILDKIVWNTKVGEIK